jgi:hypothetical protein
MLRSFLHPHVLDDVSPIEELKNVKEAINLVSQFIGPSIDIKGDTAGALLILKDTFKSSKLLNIINSNEDYIEKASKEELLVAVKFFELYAKVCERLEMHNDAEGYYYISISIDQQLMRLQASRPERYISAYIGISNLKVATAKGCCRSDRNPTQKESNFILKNLEEARKFMQAAKNPYEALESNKNSEYNILKAQYNCSIAINAIELYKFTLSLGICEDLDLSSKIKRERYLNDVNITFNKANMYLKNAYSDIFYNSYEYNSLKQAIKSLQKFEIEYNKFVKKSFIAPIKATRKLKDDYKLCVIKIAYPHVNRNYERSYLELIEATSRVQKSNRFITIPLAEIVEIPMTDRISISKSSDEIEIS